MPFSISTFFCVGMPSSSTFSEPRRLPIVPSSITVHSGLATCWPILPLNADVPLRLKSASSPVAHRFMQQDAGPIPRRGLRASRPPAHLWHQAERWPAAQLRARNLPESFIQKEIESHAPPAPGVSVLRSAPPARAPAPSTLMRAMGLAIETKFAFARGD